MTEQVQIEKRACAPTAFSKANLLANYFDQIEISFAAFNIEGEIILENAAFSSLDFKLHCSDGKARRLQTRPVDLVQTIISCVERSERQLLGAASSADNFMLEFVPLDGEGASIVTAVGYRLGSFRLASDYCLQQFYGMTARESAVSKMLIAGHSPQQIARRHDVSLGTVRVQLKSVFRKLGVSRQSQLVTKFCY